MSEESGKNSKTQLALAVARGVSINAWARASGVPRRTAFRWAKEPAVRKMVESYRRRLIDQAVGLMTQHTAVAAKAIVSIAQRGDSDTVSPRAARAVFNDMIAVSNYSGLEERMTKIERRLQARRARSDGTAAGQTSADFRPVASPPAKPPGASAGTGPG